MELEEKEIHFSNSELKWEPKPKLRLKEIDNKNFIEEIRKIKCLRYIFLDNSKPLLCVESFKEYK